MSDDEYSDQELDIEDNVEQGEEESLIVRDRGEMIFQSLNDKELEKLTNEFLSNYIKHKANINTIIDVLIQKSTINNILNKEQYVNLLTTFTVRLVETSLKQAYNDLNEDKISWEHDIFSDIKEKEKKEVAKRLQPVTIKEGIYTCKKCGGKKTQSYEVQLRRADEPATVFVECVNPKCKYSWKIN